MDEAVLTGGQRLSHAYIISSRTPDAGLAAARRLAAAAVCRSTGARPCGVCRDCRKVMEDIHPDVIILRRLTDDKGREKREIVVDQIRALAADAYVLPNEAERKVYIIREADAMNAAAQNAALKLLEEPPHGVMLLLCAANPQMLLPTVRSRCVEVIANGGEPAEDAETARLAQEFISLVAAKDRAKLLTWCFANEGMDTRSASAFIESACALTADVLCGRGTETGMERSDTARLNDLLLRCGAYLKVNTGVKHIFGLLAARAIDAGVEERKQN